MVQPVNTSFEDGDDATLPFNPTQADKFTEWLPRQKAFGLKSLRLHSTI